MPATKTPRERLTLRDGVDLLAALDYWVEENVDTLELSGGALPDDLAALLDEIDAAVADRVDAIAMKLDTLSGHAAAAKATKDRAARREKVWNNTITAVKAYALAQVQRSGGDRLRGLVATLRIQKNSAPSVELAAPAEEHQARLLALYDAAASDEALGELTPEQHRAKHPLDRFITVQRVATLDKKALAAAYEARRVELEADVAILDESDIDDEVLAAMGPADPTRAAGVADVLAQMRAIYVTDNLAAEFPGVRCERSFHLRID